MTIETQVKVLESVVAKIDTSIEKLTDVSNSIGKLLAVHDERISTLSTSHSRTEDDIREIYNRVNSISKEILDKIDNMENIIEAKMQVQAENSRQQHQAIQEGIENKLSALLDRIQTLENWRWWVIGASAAVGYMINVVLKITH